MYAMLLFSSIAAAQVFEDCPCIHEYRHFQQQFDRPTATTNEFFYRCNIFCDNARAVARHNANPHSTYTAEIKPLHDMTPDERRAHMGYGYKGPRSKAHDTFATNENVPPYDASVQTRDWYLQNRVTNVRDQGQCGDCWAESATGVLESAYFQQTGRLAQLSVEQSAECVPTQEHNAGCSGGWPIDVFRYVNQTGGLCTEADYPTTIGSGADVNCNETLTKTVQSEYHHQTNTQCAHRQRNDAAPRVAARCG